MAGRRPLSKAELRELISDYRTATSDESFERMFERDKDDLREMGIPLVTEHHDPLFDDEVGYRIDPNAYALPEIEVGPDGAQPALDGLGLEPRVSTSEPAFGPLYEAVRDRRPVRFFFNDTATTE